MKGNYSLKEDKNCGKKIINDTAKYDETITELKQKG